MEYQQEDAKDRKMYRFDEVVFDLPKDSTVEAADIETDFAAWWEYGQTDHSVPQEPGTEDPLPGSGVMSMKEMSEAIAAIQQRNAMLEDCLLEMSELVYA